ncbi:hypothetical protein PRIPAC_82929 [Pristionchus pacificus]|uniref:Sulfotransfer_1 domain-containing protein n=1 Tax=Pristionchus pacificus TaxID=54126 RepID=A0A2A6CQ66_PRIPA|nr:hypothetical protein PRIPAC_82929 [Pristionchus pacificus]|eukprot:PDM80354.1 hypothetical protein PRIPAC_32933 [Pristionchus pacificus]
MHNRPSITWHTVVAYRGGMKEGGEEEATELANCKEVMSALLPRMSIIDNKYRETKCTVDSIRSAKQMRPRTDDVFICTYPKSGTTWLQHIVHQLLDKAEYESGGEANALFFVSPMLERFGAEYAETLPSPRILKSHLAYDEIPKGGGAKYIYACRNPKDCLNSYYHHYTNHKILDFERGEFDVFFELFMSGRVASGDYFDHLSSWLQGIQNGHENILLLKYEDMVADLRASVIQIGSFLGGKAAELVQNEEHLMRIVESSTFSSMKTNQQRFYPNGISFRKDSFVRKGGSRDWTNKFSHEQSLKIDRRLKEECSETIAVNWWLTEMEWNVSRYFLSISTYSTFAFVPLSPPLSILSFLSVFCVIRLAFLLPGIVANTASLTALENASSNQMGRIEMTSRAIVVNMEEALNGAGR